MAGMHVNAGGTNTRMNSEEIYKHTNSMPVTDRFRFCLIDVGMEAYGVV